MYDGDDDDIRRRAQRLSRLRRQREWLDDDWDEPLPVRYRSRSMSGGWPAPFILFLLLILVVGLGVFWLAQRMSTFGAAMPNLQVIVQTPTPQIISGAPWCNAFSN